MLGRGSHCDCALNEESLNNNDMSCTNYNVNNNGNSFCDSGECSREMQRKLSHSRKNSGLLKELKRDTGANYSGSSYSVIRRDVGNGSPSLDSACSKMIKSQRSCLITSRQSSSGDVPLHTSSPNSSVDVDQYSMDSAQSKSQNESPSEYLLDREEMREDYFKPGNFSDKTKSHSYSGAFTSDSDCCSYDDNEYSCHECSGDHNECAFQENWDQYHPCPDDCEYLAGYSPEYEYCNRNGDNLSNECDNFPLLEHQEQSIPTWRWTAKLLSGPEDEVESFKKKKLASMKNWKKEEENLVVLT